MNKKAVISLTIKMSYHIYILIPVLSPSTALMWSLCIRCNALKKGAINLQGEELFCYVFWTQ